MTIAPSRAAGLCLVVLLSGCSGAANGTNRADNATSASPVPLSPKAGHPTADATASSAAPGASGSAAVTVPPPPATPSGPSQLPRGGRTILPSYRLVGFAGNPGSPALGRLGVGSLATKGREITQLGRSYARGRSPQVLPMFELIASVVHRGAGKDGMYRSRVDDATIARYLAAARRAKGLLLLDIQPGRADFLPETRAYERWLAEPDVGVALDPEWAIEAGQTPGESYGRTTGSELDVVATYLAGIVAKHQLPEKVMVFHQVAPSIVRDVNRLHQHKGVFLVRSVDGIGSPGAKRGTWTRLVAGSPAFLHTGFKLFYVEDRDTGGRLMTPAEVLALRPRPDYVMYE